MVIIQTNGGENEGEVAQNGKNLCLTCPDTKKSLEFQTYKDDNEIGYTLLAGNWVKDSGKKGEVQLVNGKAYEYKFRRWIPMYNPKIEVLVTYTYDYGANFLFSWGVTGTLSKAWGVSGIGLAVGFVFGAGQAGTRDANSGYNGVKSTDPGAVTKVDPKLLKRLIK